MDPQIFMAAILMLFLAGQSPRRRCVDAVAQFSFNYFPPIENEEPGSLAIAQLEARPRVQTQSGIIEALGWSIQFPDNFTSKAVIPLPKAWYGRHCLESCIENATLTGCHLVQHNFYTRQCIGFTAEVEGTFRQTLGMSLLALSKKTFTPKVGDIVRENFNPIIGADGSSVANNGVVYGEARCISLCHLHPKCSATSSMTDSYFELDPKFGNNCTLMTSSTSFYPDADCVNCWVSYIS